MARKPGLVHTAHVQIAPIQASSLLDLAQHARAGSHSDMPKHGGEQRHFDPHGFPYGNAIQVIEAAARVASPEAEAPGTNLDVKI